MIEININKIISWKEINRIKNLAKDDIVVIKMPESVYYHKKMKYKIEDLKDIPTIIINVENKERGRKKIIDDEIKEKIIELIKENYSIREIAEILGVKKSTVWYYAKDFIKVYKIEKLKSLLFEFKEKAIEEEWYDSYAKTLFLELESYIKTNNLENAYKILHELIKYRKHKKHKK